MAFKKRGNSDRTDSRITGFFKTKRKGLYVGGARDQQLDALIKKIKEAKADGRGITFFLWKSKFEEGPVFSLNVDVERDQSERPKRRQVQPADDLEEDEDEVDEDEDDLFGKD